MPYIEVAVPVKCEPFQVYQIIKDMEKYPDFMPDLISVTVINRTDNQTITSWVSNVDGRIIRWTEEDTFNDDKMHIGYKQLEGDLKKFEGEWIISSIADGTEIKLTVDFEFGIPMLAGLLNPILKKKVKDNSYNMLSSIKNRLEQ